MKNDRKGSRYMLHQIADALGIDISDLLEDTHGRQAIAEALAMTTAFERVKSPEDRRACLDFVNAVLARQQPAVP